MKKINGMALILGSLIFTAMAQHNALANKEGSGQNDDPLAYDALVIDHKPILQISDQELKKVLNDVELAEKTYQLPPEEFYTKMNKDEVVILEEAKTLFATKLKNFGEGLGNLRSTAYSGLAQLATEMGMPYTDTRRELLRARYRQMGIDLFNQVAGAYAGLGGTLATSKDEYSNIAKKCTTNKCVQMVTDAFLEWMGAMKYFGQHSLNFKKLIEYKTPILTFKNKSEIIQRAYAQWVGDTFQSEQSPEYTATKALQSFKFSGLKVSENLAQMMRDAKLSLVGTSINYINLYNANKRSWNIPQFPDDNYFEWTEELDWNSNGGECVVFLICPIAALFTIPGDLFVHVPKKIGENIETVGKRIANDFRDYYKLDMKNLQTDIMNVDADLIIANTKNRVSKDNPQ